jgi:hypothetical protein
LYLPRPYHHRMRRNKTKKKPKETRDAIIKGIARPRLSKSARIAVLNLDSARIVEPPTTLVAGIVTKIVPSPSHNKPDKAQVSMDLPDRQYRELRIENTLTDEHGDDFRLKKGAHVDVTVTAKEET